MPEETPPAEKPVKPAKILLKDPPITVGRIVLFTQHEGDEPHAAQVCKVWGGEMVNLDVVDENGHHYTATSVNKGTGAGQWRFPTRVGGES